VGERAVVYTIPKGEVSKVVYNDGTEDVFEAQAQNQYVPNAQPSAPTSKYTYIIRNDMLNYYDTVGSVSFKYAKYAAMHNYKVSAGYSGLGFNTFVSFDFIRRMRRFDEETLLTNRVLFAEYGIGLVQKGILALSVGPKWFWEINDYALLYGIDIRLSKYGLEETMDFEFLLYRQWLFSLGISAVFGNDAELSVALGTGYFFKEIKKSELPVTDAIKHRKKKSDRPRYFRSGIELNYPVYRSEIEFFNNKFPYASGGAGLFFRVGPDNFYFTTGVNAKLDYLWRDSVVSAQLTGPFGITLARLPLLDMYWEKLSMEVPLLLNFGAGQVRFSGGMLLDFYAVSEFNITVSVSVPWIGGQPVISENDADRLEERFNEAPTGSTYLALGLDFDIVKYWGIGVKLLFLTGSFGETDSYEGFKPSELQTRISMYFVF
jgi:hypothetical protein